MKLSYVFEQLTHGELAMLAIGGGEAGIIEEKNFRHVGNHVWLGLTALYKRFNLKGGELTLQLEPGRYLYPLKSRYAVNDDTSLELSRFILDTPDAPFLEDVLKVSSVKAVTSKVELALNDFSDMYPVTTPTLDSIRVANEIVDAQTMVVADFPDWLKTDKLLVEYSANHPNFVPRVGYYDPELTEIELPMSHLQALLYFVASRAHNPIGMGQEFNAGNNWAQRFEQECQRLETDGIEIDTSSQGSRARRNGWK